MEKLRTLNIQTWYLARLRRLVTASSEDLQKLTPLSLVESDKKLIQNIVAQASDTQSVRAAKFKNLIGSQNGFDRNADLLILLEGLAGLLLILAAFFC